MATRAQQLVGAAGLTFVALALASGATSWSGAAPALARASEPRPRAAADQHGGPPAIRFWELLQRQQVAAPPLSSLSAKACPPLEPTLPAAARVLQLTAVDARVEPKQLLPLALTARLGDGPLLGAVEEQLLGTETRKAAEARLQQLSQRRFRGVYRIVDYAEPRLVRKIDKPRPEWLPGVLSASFVIQDLQDGRALCQSAALIVRNDVATAPISARQRATTRDRLLLALGDALRQQTEPALRQIGSQLQLPPRN